MRTLIKGFVAVSIVSAGFLCGLTNDVLSTAIQNPQVGSIIPSVPASRVARLLEPAAGPVRPVAPGDLVLLTVVRNVASYLPSFLAHYRRLGVEPLSLPGSHSPFLSRPKDLAAVLASLV